MKADYILQADLLDIIFEKRNKDYGAYPLRKHYEERVYRALAIIFGFIALLSLYSLLHNKSNDLVPYITKDVEMGRIEETPKPVENEKPKQAPAQPKTTAPVSGFVLVDSTQKSDVIDNPDSLFVTSHPGPADGHFSPVPGDGPPVAIPAPAAPVTPVVPVVDRNIPVAAVDIPPSFPGGMDGLRKFLERNLRNPGDAMEDIITVKVRFIVGYLGNLKSFEIIEDGGKVYNDEVIRVLKKMPAWNPGSAKGENVSAYFTIPVKFVPQE